MSVCAAVDVMLLELVLDSAGNDGAGAASAGNELLLGGAAVTVDRLIPTDAAAGMCPFVVGARAALANLLAGAPVPVGVGAALAPPSVGNASVGISFTTGTGATGTRAAGTRVTGTRVAGTRAAVGAVAGAAEGAEPPSDGNDPAANCGCWLTLLATLRARRVLRLEKERTAPGPLSRRMEAAVFGPFATGRLLRGFGFGAGAFCLLRPVALADEEGPGADEEDDEGPAPRRGNSSGPGAPKRRRRSAFLLTGGAGAPLSVGKSCCGCC